VSASRLSAPTKESSDFFCARGIKHDNPPERWSIFGQ
jgi:hypothetical protein